MTKEAAPATRARPSSHGNRSPRTPKLAIGVRATGVAPGELELPPGDVPLGDGLGLPEEPELGPALELELGLGLGLGLGCGLLLVISAGIAPAWAATAPASARVYAAWAPRWLAEVSGRYPGGSWPTPPPGASPCVAAKRRKVA